MPHPTDAVPRFIVGIDLGTTNSALCYVETSGSARQIETFSVPQLVAPGEIELREGLPSFFYQPASKEFPSGSLSLPWSEGDDEAVVGLFAREQGKLVPGRVVESAKSWLCHPGVDRTSPLLPWHGSTDVSRKSPVEVSAAYLAHLRNAWNHTHRDAPLETQDVVLTLPASFDEVARELTVEAAKQAGLPRVLLIEEPQAAFYAWLDAHVSDWKEIVSPGQNILVCDIGGGTSDFTLIRVRPHADEGVQFHRIAVGEHLILGGDNLDLALAHHLESRLATNGKLEPRQWGSLVRVCRHAKEVLLGDDAPESYTVTLPGSGSKLIGGGLSLTVEREEVRQLLLEGFFPQVRLDDRPSRKGSGFQEFGLPYAPDAAVTRYLAEFLSEHCRPHAHDTEPASTRPDVVLFNGGMFNASVIQDRVLESIREWYAEGSDWSPLVLKNPRHDLAVARGATYYGRVRRGEGIRIAAGLPRTYYVGIEAAANPNQGEAPANAAQLQALCLVPAGTEPGDEIDLSEHPFHLTVATPVEFPLFHSSVRLTDPPGSLTEIEREQLTPLPPIRTVLRLGREKASRTVTVTLHSRLTEIGTLELWCSDVESPRNWQLQFDVRSATQTDMDAHEGTGEAAGVLDEESTSQAREIIERTFSPNGQEKAGGLPKRIARTIDMSRDDWPPTLLRQIWSWLLENETGREKSAEHEARWLNLLGFSLRPGYGMALDDWRVLETWKRLRSRLSHPGTAVLSEWWILWRRISGGLPGGQQQALANPLVTRIREEHRKWQKTGRSKRSNVGGEEIEAWRMLGSLERLPMTDKQQLGEIALDFLDDEDRRPIHAALHWSLGRIGAREMLYGPLNQVLSPEVISDWLERLISQRNPESDRLLAVMQLARKTGDRYRDLDESLRSRVVNWLIAGDAPEAFVTLVESGGSTEAQTRAMIFGESLPVGLRLPGTGG